MTRRYHIMEVSGFQDGRTIMEEVITDRDQDALSMAIRRNGALAGCNSFLIRDRGGFYAGIRDEVHREKKDILQFADLRDDDVRKEAVIKEEKWKAPREWVQRFGPGERGGG